MFLLVFCFLCLPPALLAQKPLVEVVKEVTGVSEEALVSQIVASVEQVVSR